MLACLRACCALLLSLATLAAVVARPPGASADLTCAGFTPTQPPLVAPGKLVGTDGDDVLIGSDGDDVILGGKGNDIICAGLGSDHVSGGAGNDYLIGEDIAAFICHAGYGADVLLGGPGNDTLFDACGDNIRHGDGGDDTLLQSTGTADGGTGNDVVTAMADYVACPATPKACATAHARGGAGNDTVEVAGGDADGGPGNDAVRGDSAGDIVKGGPGTDTLTHYLGASGFALDGGSGRDTCEVAAGDIVRRCEVVT
jgi:serralysin